MAANDELTPAEFARLRSLPPADAVAWMRGRGRLAETFSWQDLWQGEHSEQFTVSRLARADLLQALRDGLTKSVAGDLTRRDWARNAEKLLADAGWWGVKAVTDPATGDVVLTKFDPARLKLIYDTNTRQAYAAGQWERLQRSKRVLPYLRYVTKRDDRVRPLHASWDNVTLLVDDPFWQTHFPPNGWRCRCRVVGVSEREYEAGKAPGGAPLKKTRPDVVTTEFINRRTGEVSQVPAGIDPGFDFTPGAARRAARDRLVTDKLAALSPDLAAAARQVGLTPAPAGAATSSGAALGSVAGSAASARPWVHPQTGKLSVQLDQLPAQGEARVLIQQVDRPLPNGRDYVIRVDAAAGNVVDVAALVREAEAWIELLTGGRAMTLAALVAQLGM